MELKIYNPTEDGFIKSIEWNHEEIKKEVSEKVEYYKNLVYTDDQIKEAKADRATLRKFVDALETKRKEIKKQCLAPYEDFEKQMKEIVVIVNEPVALIDAQVKGYEEKQKEEKKAKIVEIFDSIGFQPFVKLEMIWDEKWLNASVTLKKIEESMKEMMYKFSSDLLTLSKLPEFGFEATEIYKTTLDINKALEKAQNIAEIAKKKAEYEAQQKAREEEQARLAAEAEAKKQDEEMVVVGNVNTQINVDGQPVTVAEIPVEVPIKQWVKFKAFLTTEDALALKQFFNDRNIEFEAI